ncbi:uncharacterized protein TNCV_1625801 [Trichonephila clavipes]|nr:uncharacterized protein TNCV_1625801 [Trichonephila clavipes]
MGSRFRKLKALLGKKKFSDEKTTGGNGHLTDAVIRKLTSFYGNAIWSNSQNVNEMMEAVWAVWDHTSSTDDEPKHWFGPKGKKIAGHPIQTDTQGTFFMPYNHTAWPLSIFCIKKIHRLGPGSNPQPWKQNDSDKPTKPPNRRLII